MNNRRKKKITVKEIVLTGMFAAFLAVVSQLSIPMPAGVPITIQVFGIALAGTILGTRQGVMAVLVYILIGAVGAPVFANFQGGLQVIAGTTGGYIIGWPFMAALCGIRTSGSNKNTGLFVRILLALCGLAIVESTGALQWAFLTQTDIRTILIYSFTAFIPKDIVITILAVLIGGSMKKQLDKIMQ